MEGFFQGRKISAHDSFRRRLNRYDVIRIDVQWCLTSVKSGDKTVSYIEKNVIEELRGLFKGANSITHGSDSPQLAAFYKNAERSEVQANTPQLAAGKFIGVYPSCVSDRNFADQEDSDTVRLK